ncbi:hypothetical protein [Streptomyces coffeae]|uniref:Uncharacterized protein n=1 Tax=Streptomyces coffeae TaxID=621382 RepID=A0ABS1NC26_9ACTN|nr:hypothetical protein [Streptomyces coffeae]MBL1097509.1 hypothetical protein [Streptomyces coffeae]
MDRNEQPLLTPDLPPLVEVPDLTFPARGSRADGATAAVERDGDKESSIPSPTPGHTAGHPLAA